MTAQTEPSAKTESTPSMEEEEVPENASFGDSSSGNTSIEEPSANKASSAKEYSAKELLGTEEKSISSLDALLKRSDVWRGHSYHFVPQEALSTGYKNLDQALNHGGWPIQNLVEVCQASGSRYGGDIHGGTEWFLFAPVIQQLNKGEHNDSYIILLNPPSVPFASGLINAGIPLNRLLIITPQTKQDFIACFVELARHARNDILFAWQPKQDLTYTELRKCQLASTEGQGLCVLFRTQHEKKHSSPAALRLGTEINDTQIDIDIFKQKGNLQCRQTRLDIPYCWKDIAEHRNLGIEPAQIQSKKSGLLNQTFTPNNIISFEHKGSHKN